MREREEKEKGKKKELKMTQCHITVNYIQLTHHVDKLHVIYSAVLIQLTISPH